MKLTVVCPVCQFDIEISDDSLGRKLRCGQCESKSRVKEKEGGKLFLQVLEETLDWESKVATSVESDTASCGAPVRDETVAEDAKKPAGPKLTTRRDKFREQEAGASAGGRGRPTTRGRSAGSKRRRF